MTKLNWLKCSKTKILIGSVLSLYSCGTEEFQDKLTTGLESALVLATYEDLLQNRVLPNSYMVAFRTEARNEFASYAQEFRAHYSLLVDDYASTSGIVEINHISSLDLNPVKGPTLEDFSPPTGLQLAWGSTDTTNAPILASLAQVDFRSGDDAVRILKEWEASGKIWFAEPNYTNSLTQQTPTPTPTPCPTNNAWCTYAQQYAELVGSGTGTGTGTSSTYFWHKMVNTVGAFGYLKDQQQALDDQPIIAVMDSGVDAEHSAIKQRIWQNDAVGEAGCGSDDLYGCNTTKAKKGSLGNGDVFPAKTDGYNSVCPPAEINTSDCDSQCCHGTHVAGIIAGVPSKELGGICPACRIMIIRVVGQAAVGLEGKSYTILDSWIAAGLKYVSAFKKGSPVRVINASFGKFQRSRSIAVLVSALANSNKSKGTLVVGAAGNEDSSKMQYPAGYNDAIAVANVGSDKRKSPSSNFGRWVDVSAPGSEVTSCVPGGGFKSKSGTSMASPVVAGIAGLVLAANPSISVSDLRNIITNSADPKIYDDEVNSSYLINVRGEDNTIPLLGTGLVQASEAVQKKSSDDLPAVLPLDRVGPGCGVLAGSNSAVHSFLLLLLSLLPVILLRFLLGSRITVTRFNANICNIGRCGYDFATRKTNRCTKVGRY